MIINDSLKLNEVRSIDLGNGSRIYHNYDKFYIKKNGVKKEISQEQYYKLADSQKPSNKVNIKLDNKESELLDTYVNLAVNPKSQIGIQCMVTPEGKVKTRWAGPMGGYMGTSSKLDYNRIKKYLARNNGRDDYYTANEDTIDKDVIDRVNNLIDKLKGNK